MKNLILTLALVLCPTLSFSQNIIQDDQDSYGGRSIKTSSEVFSIGDTAYEIGLYVLEQRSPRSDYSIQLKSSEEIPYPSDLVLKLKNGEDLCLPARSVIQTGSGLFSANFKVTPEELDRIGASAIVSFGISEGPLSKVFKRNELGKYISSCYRVVLDRIAIPYFSTFDSK